MEQRRDDGMTIKQLKKKYNKLIEKYLDKKKLLKKLANAQLKNAERIANIEQEMKRLSDNNAKILKEKHAIERKTEELQTQNYTLQLEVNSQSQSVHKLTMEKVYDHKSEIVCVLSMYSINCHTPC